MFGLAGRGGLRWGVVWYGMVWFGVVRAVLVAAADTWAVAMASARAVVVAMVVRGKSGRWRRQRWWGKFGDVTVAEAARQDVSTRI